MLIHVDLYAGIAGFTLAAEKAGFETVLFVEKDAYCQKVLRKHYPNVPIVEDIRDVEKIKEIVANTTEQRLHNQENEQELARARSSKLVSLKPRIMGGTNHREQEFIPAILVTAGFPCQPFSVAGKREGERDDRYLWPETLTVIEAIKPKWVLLENVTGIINLALDTVLSDLEGAGYSYETLIIPACAVNAWHRRDRIWVVAHSQCCRCDSGEHRLSRRTNTASGADHTQSEQDRARQGSRISKASQDVPNTQQPTSRRGRFTGDTGDCERRATEAQREGIQSQDGPTRSSNIESSSQDVPNTESRGMQARSEFNREASKDGGLDAIRCRKDVTDTKGKGLEGADTERDSCSTGQPLQSGIDTEGNGIQGGGPVIDSPISRDWWAAKPGLGGMVDGLSRFVDGYFDTEPDIPRVTTGVKNRKERIQAIGNAIVPQVAYQILKVIAELA